jgi:MAD (mothers against decapentaplegic) interacting protein
VDNPNEHSSLQNELLLDLNEAFDTVLTKDESVYLKIESSTLLDQSFTEDAVTQPLLTNIIIQNGAFNPSHPDTLTDDELESYLAELEKEDEGEISQPTIDVNSGQEASSNHEPSCSPSMSEADKENTVSNINIVDEEISSVLPITEEVENLPLSDSEITSTEDSNGSSYSDSDSAEVNPQFQEDSLSAEEEMPQLIDDPCLVNSEIVTEIMPSQIIVDDTINAIADHNLPCEESNQEVPSSSEMVDDISGNIAEDLPATLDFQEESNVTSVMSGLSQGDDSLLEPYSSLTEDERLLGVLKPVWIPDEEAPQCMNCSQRFTVIRRRHHCRACGRVLCNNCCSSRARLEYMESTETRVCLPCLQVLRKVEAYKKWGGVTETQTSNTAVDSGSLGSFDSTSASSPSPHFPNPVVRVNVNNPAEYCSTVPPALQIAAAAALPTPTVMVPTVPVGVLKKEGTPSHPRTKSEPKQVCSLFYI